MEMLQLYVVYDESLKPVDSNIGSFNRYNHKIDRINIEINEALPEHTFYLNVKRPDGTVNLLGYEVVQVDGTNYYFDVPAWVTEEDGLVEFSLVASTLSQVISFGKFYVDCIDTLQATAQATPDDPTFLSKVDKDLSTYEEVTLTDDTLARVYVDDDGEPSQMSIGALVDKAQQEIPFLSFEIPTTHTPLLEGEIAWNETQGTIDIGMKGGNVTQEVGMELYIRCRNDDSVTITDGMVVYSVGTVGASGVIRVMRASASDDEVSGRVIGVTTEPIAPNGVGYVTVLGEVNGIDTSLMTPEATLYLGENGAFTETIPTAPTKKIIIGRVMRVAVNGSIYVRLQKGVSLKELDDVVQNGTATGGILVYDSVAGTWGTGDVTFTETDNDLYINTDLDKIVLNKATEVNGNLNVKGILTQDGSAYETHLEQLYTEKDHIILRDGAVSGLGVGSYAGLFAKLADGTNNAGLVFDGDGMARVGDIGTDLASPDFTETQALATRQDSPVANAVAYWNDTLKRFDTSSGLVADLGDNANIGFAIDKQGTLGYPFQIRVGGSTKLRVQTSGTLSLYEINSIGYGSGQGGSLSFSNLGITLSRNYADTNPALKVQNSHTDSTGSIAEFWSNVGGTTAIRAKIDKGGYIYGSRFYDITHNYTYLNMTNNGANFYRNQNDANTLLTINNQQGTGNILNLQFGGANKLEVTKDGWLTQNGTRLFHQTGGISNTFFGSASGNLTTTAQNAVAYGNGALASLTNGVNNVGIGSNALTNTTTGQYDTAVGQGALLTNISGTFLTALGWNAGRYIADGSTSNTTSDYSVYLGGGTKAGADNNQNEIVIGYNAIGNGSNTATLGNSSIVGYYFNANPNAIAYFGKINEAVVVNDAIADVPLTINAITGQTGNLLNLQVNGTNVASIGANGDGQFNNIDGANITASNGIYADYIEAQDVLNINAGEIYITAATVDIPYDNTTSGLTATKIQEAIDEVAETLENISITNLNEITVSNDAVGDVPITINAITGQTANIQSWQVNGVEKAKVDSDGHFYDNGFYLQSNIINTNIVVSTWVADATISGYGYRATITMTGATANDIPYVHLSEADRLSGNYYEECESITDGIYIYSKVNTSITIPWAKIERVI